MKFHHLRSATSIVTYAGQRLLIDPMLDPVGTREPVENTPNQLRNPLTALPVGALEAIADINAVLVTHLHADHLDEMGKKLTPRIVPWFCLAEQEERLAGFPVAPIADQVMWEGITISRVPAQHGHGPIAELLAPVSGFIFQAEGEPTLYLASDTVWYEGVATTLADFTPEVTIINGGGGYFLGAGPVVMTAEDIAEVHRAAPASQLVIVHLDAINHCTDTRAFLRERLPQLGVADRVLIPEDGEELTIRA